MFKDGMKYYGAAVAGVVGLLLVIVAVWALTVAWAPWKGAGDQRKQTEGSAQYRIAAYDRFYDLCAAIQSKEDQIDNLRAEAPTDKARAQQVNAAITALLNTRASLIRRYNADAAKADTRANFLASDLPFVIDPNQEHTSCAA